MSTNYLALRSSAAPTLTVSTLLGSTISIRSITLQSTTISLGQSTNHSYINFSNGSFTTGWASTLTGATSIKDVVLSPNGSVQTILQNSGSTMSTVITSLNSGQTWAGSTMRGLPISGDLPYQTYGSTINAMTVPTITAITAAPSGTNQLAIASNELVYASANSGATFAATGLGQNNSPFIYIPFDGSSVTDVMGNSAVTATGSIAYVTGKVGTQAVNVNNSAAVGGTATQYLRGTWTGASNFTFSGWFNAQTINGTQQMIYSAYQNQFTLLITTSNQLQAFTPSGGAASAITIGVTSFTIARNTWYSFTIVYQAGGICSFYVNNTLIGTTTNVRGIGTLTSTQFSLGTYDDTLASAFNGYIDDFRIYNYAVTNPSGAALINPIVGPIMPYVYLTFDGSTTTDVMGNSTVTATGSPGFVAGKVGSNALDLSTNTAGGAPTKYISGTWAGTSNFTVSGWFNAQAIPASGVAMIFSAGTGANSAFQVFITLGGVFTVYTADSYATSTITTGIWYFFQIVYQSSGTCYVYLNGTQATTFAGTTLSATPTIFTVGVYTHTATTGAFRGYIDDIRIYNGAFLPSQLNPVLYSPSHAVGSPNIYLPFENSSVLDAMGYSAISAKGTMNFVPGVVGTAALNLVNPMGGTAVNYLRGSWAGAANFTVSFWFNAQALGAQQALFSAYTGSYAIYLNPSNQIVIYLPSGGTSLNAITGPVISINTWYYVTANFQTNGTCTLYLNNSLIGSYTNSGGVSPYTTAAFGIGTYDHNTIQAFNGYIDDFKIYNSAIPFSALGPMNYTQAAISNSGAYQVVATANGGVYTSANSGSTWSQATLAALQPAAAVNTVGGQIITPNLTGLANSGTALTTPPWLQNGVSWVASASSIVNIATFSISNLFNNTAANTNIWANSSLTYTTSGNSSGVNTVILGLGTATGDWAQIQSSVPLVMASYQFATGSSVVQLPKTYYIVGSNNGTAWYPIQYGSGGAVTSTAQYTLVPGVIIVNSASVQTFGSSTITTTTYSTTTNAYLYFRLIGLSNYNASATYLEIGEWYINFATPPTPLYVAPSTALIANQSLNAITVMPQQTGLASSTWTTNGVSWVSSASTTATTNYPYNAFNSTNASAYYTGTFYNGNTGAYTGSLSTAISGLSAATGEWLQIQSSVPLIMSSYTFACTGWWQLAKTGFIVGSTDGTTWFPIQSFTMTTNPFTANFLTASNYITIGPTGTQTQTIYGNQAGSGSFTGYATSSNTYTYFRFIASTISGATTNTNASNNDQFGPAEWLINFTAYTPALLQSLTMSPSGQYMALTGAGATAPQLAGLAASTWTANDVSWTASASTTLTSGIYDAYRIFNNTYDTNSRWVPSSNSYSTAGNSSGISNTIIGIVGTQTGDWLQIQSSVPLVMTSYQFATGDLTARLPKTYYITGSNDGSNWYPLQYVSGGAVTTTAIRTLVAGVILINSTSTQAFGSSTVATTSYSTSTNAYTYFRLVCLTSYSSAADLIDIGEWYINFQSGLTFYSTDYGSNWTRSLTAATVPNANVLATSGNGQYTLQASGQTVFIAINTSVGNPTGNYTTPTFSPALSNAVSNAAVSATGQYIVLVTQGTTNNVYYSSNYGVSFTGITLGSTAMVSCAVSADGSYITVASATQVFTLNSNTQGLSITVGNQSGLINQGHNAVAIGNQAGHVNQSANSIVLNSSGTVVNAYAPGFFVAPVALAGSSVSSSFSILGYGTDSQVVQTGVSITSGGYVGIGSTIPRATLDVNGSINTNGTLTLNGSTFTKYGATSGYNMTITGGTATNSPYLEFFAAGTRRCYIGDATTAAMTIAAENGASLNFLTSNSNRMVITSGGLVGIGSTIPGATLDVNGTISTNGTFTKNGATGGYNMTIAGGDTTNSPFLEFWAAGTRRCYIGSATTTSMTIAAENSASLNFLTSNSNRMVITSGGLVGIGSTIPGATLDVNGSISTNGTLTLNNSTFTKYGTDNNSYMTIKGGGSGWSPYLEFFASGARRGLIGDATTSGITIAAENGGNLYFNTSYSTRVTITSGGTVILPYFVWHFNWSSNQSIGVVGSVGSLVNSINSTNISGTYINNPSQGRFTVPHSGVYICTFDVATLGDTRTVILLRIDGVNYNPYATSIGGYQQAIYTEVLYLTSGQIIDWYCSVGGTQSTSVLQIHNGSGKGISFALMR